MASTTQDVSTPEEEPASVPGIEPASLEGPGRGQRVVVAMSGGVDSSAVAWLFRERECEVLGLFMRNGVHVTEEESSAKSCCSVSDARDARMVAAHLGIPFQAVDLASEFSSIIEYFIDEYRRGRTPNPCAVCNRDLKFDRLLSFADELGAEGVATGHYVRKTMREGRVEIRRGVDETKDQSYQLFCVAEAHLARAWFPLGGTRKDAVRKMAREAGLRTAAKRDSQEICFVPSNDYRRLLAERQVPLHPGHLEDTAGRRIGTHEGTEHFTIGQRRGHGIGGGTPLYVIELRPETGVVVLGTRDECGSLSARVRDLNWIGFDPPAEGGFEALVQLRYRSRPSPARVEVDGGEARLLFEDPQVSITPGQGAAFYGGDRLLGGGWIEAGDQG